MAFFDISALSTASNSIIGNPSSIVCNVRRPRSPAKKQAKGIEQPTEVYTFR